MAEDICGRIVQRTQVCAYCFVASTGGAAAWFAAHRLECLDMWPPTCRCSCTTSAPFCPLVLYCGGNGHQEATWTVVQTLWYCGALASERCVAVVCYQRLVPTTCACDRPCVSRCCCWLTFALTFKCLCLHWYGLSDYVEGCGLCGLLCVLFVYKFACGSFGMFTRSREHTVRWRPHPLHHVGRRYVALMVLLLRSM